MRRTKIGAAGLAGVLLASLASCSVAPDETHAELSRMCASASGAALRSYDPLAMGSARGGYAAVANLSGAPDWKRTEASLRLLSLSGIPIGDTNLKMLAITEALSLGLAATELSLTDLERISNVNQLAEAGVKAGEFENALTRFEVSGGYGWSEDAEESQPGSNAMAARVISANGLDAASMNIEVKTVMPVDSVDQIINEGVPDLIARVHLGESSPGTAIDTEQIAIWHNKLLDSLPSPIAVASLHDLHELGVKFGFAVPSIPEGAVHGVAHVGQVLASIDGRTPEFGVTADLYELIDEMPSESLLASIVRTSNANGWQAVTSFNDLEATYHSVSLLTSCGYDAPLSSDYIEEVLSSDDLDPRSALMACGLAKIAGLDTALSAEDALEDAANESSIYASAAALQCSLTLDSSGAPGGEYRSMADVFRDGSQTALSSEQQSLLGVLDQGDGSALAYVGAEEPDLISSIQSATLSGMPTAQRGTLIESFTCEGVVRLLAPSEERDDCGSTTLAYWHLAIDFLAELEESHFAWTIPMRSS